MRHPPGSPHVSKEPSGPSRPGDAWTAESLAGDYPALEPAESVSSIDITRFLDAEHRGEPVDLVGVGSLANARSWELAFCVHNSPAKIRSSEAGAVLCSNAVGDVDGITQIVVPDPRLGFARVANAFFSNATSAGTDLLHGTAYIHPDARIGAETKIGAHVYVSDAVSIGTGCTIRAGATIGGAGFGFARDEAGTPHRIPHQGRVRIEDGVEIGSHCSIDRAVFDETRIGRNSKLSGQVHVAHQVTIGSNTIIAFGAGFGGGSSIGDRVTIHPHVTVAEGVKIGNDSEVGMNSTVLEDVPDGATVVGSPARAIENRDAESRGSR